MRGVAARLSPGLLVVMTMAAAGCAARLPPRPSGAAVPAPDAVPLFEQATAHCAGLRTLTLELALSGRAGAQRVRGRIIAGLERGGMARLEGVAPFGAPVFILAARAEQATLLLPRDRRVLASASVTDVIERLTGLPVGADDLRRVLAGCLGAGGEAHDGRQWPRGWRAVSTPGNRTVFLRQRAGRWQVAAADGGGWRADYREVVDGLPSEVRLRADDGTVDLLARVEQLQMNTSIDPAAFEVSIPPGTAPMTLSELTSVAPLRTP